MVVLYGYNYEPCFVQSLEDRERLVFCVTNCGFYSEVNVMLSAWWLAEQMGVSFAVDPHTHCGSSPYRRDFMRRYYEGLPIGSASHECEEVRLGSWFFCHFIRYCNAHLSFEAKTPYAHRLHYKHDAKRRVDALVDRAGIEGEFAALHIRRGDKVTAYSAKHPKEADFIGAADYLAKVPASCPSVLVLTDDYAAVEEVRSLTDRRVYYLGDAARSGNRTMERLENPWSDGEVDELLAEVELAVRASVFVGTMSSNLSRYVAMRRGTLETSHTLDDPWHGG